jgi:hypothetical protein
MLQFDDGSSKNRWFAHDLPHRCRAFGGFVIFPFTTNEAEQRSSGR